MAQMTPRKIAGRVGLKVHRKEMITASTNTSQMPRFTRKEESWVVVRLRCTNQAEVPARKTKTGAQ